MVSGSCIDDVTVIGVDHNITNCQISQVVCYSGPVDTAIVGFKDASCSRTTIHYIIVDRMYSNRIDSSSRVIWLFKYPIGRIAVFFNGTLGNFIFDIPQNVVVRNKIKSCIGVTSLKIKLFERGTFFA